MNEFGKLYELIERSHDFDEVRSSGMLPEPDSDDGYYFISYSHRDYKPVIKDIVSMREAGALLWYDRGLESGKSWISEVRQKMSSYYCKGVIVYLSANYLESYSCMLELDHLLTSTFKSAVFILLDDSVSKDASELLTAAGKHGLACANDPLLATGNLFVTHELMTKSDTTEQKLAACARFSEPQLLEYTFHYGVGDAANRIMDLFLGRIASVSGVADKNAKRVVIPSTVIHDGKKYKVALIQTSAFFQCELLEEVVVSDGWLMIHEHAFSRCPSLKRVILGKPLRALGTRLGVVNEVFDRCPHAKLEPSTSIVNLAAFKGRDDIREARHEDKSRWFGQSFAYCVNLERVELGRNDRFVDRMFIGCISLREVVIPRGNVTRKISRSFEGCESLTYIQLPRALREIGSHSFYGCKSLVEVYIPPRVRFIARDAFEGCTAVERVVVDAGKMRNYNDLPYHRACLLDELFPTAKTFYLRHVPRGKRIFVGNFTEVESDRSGYKMYVKEDE